MPPSEPLSAEWPDQPAFALLRAAGGIPALAVATTADDLSRWMSLDGPVRNSRGEPLRAVEAAADGGAAAYELGVFEHGELPVRPLAWHDRFNVAAWRLFPRTKAALNAAHVAEIRQAVPGTPRSRRRDALTGFDEDGAIVAVVDPALAECIRQFRWRELFVTRRASLTTALEAAVLGHAALEKLLAPFVGLTAKAILVPVEAAYFTWTWDRRCAWLDEAAASAVAGLGSPQDLWPLPLLGLPGWWPGNEDPAFYDDVRYFRPGRRGTKTRSA